MIPVAGASSRDQAAPTKHTVHRWLIVHRDALAGLTLATIAAALVVVFRRAWPLLLPVPALFSLYAWYEWEYSSEAFPLVVGIAVFSYAGLAVGFVVARALRRRSS